MIKKAFIKTALALVGYALFMGLVFWLLQQPGENGGDDGIFLLIVGTPMFTGCFCVQLESLVNAIKENDR